MCPDRELLSAYMDGEVPSPWKERIAEHLASCAKCSAVVRDYGSLSENLASAPCPGEAGIVERGRTRFEAELASRAAVPRRASLSHFERGQRMISVPLPLAAAAAIAILALAGLNTVNLIASNHGPKPALATAEVVPHGAQQVSMDDVLHYLDSQNAQLTLTIKLPSEATFNEPGTPVIVRAPRSLAPKTEAAKSAIPKDGAP